MSLKTENSRRVAKSRPVCMGIYVALREQIGPVENVILVIVILLPVKYTVTVKYTTYV
jgi:hypothetical protein